MITVSPGFITSISLLSSILQLPIAIIKVRTKHADSSFFIRFGLYEDTNATQDESFSSN